MSESKSVCKQSAEHKDTIKKIQQNVEENITDLKEQARKAGKNAINKLTGQNEKTKTRFQKFLSFITPTQAAPSTRPDLVFFRNILLLLAAIVIVYYALPRLSGSVKTGFNVSQFQKAVKLPESAFNIEEIAKVNQEVKAFQDHKSFFDDGGAFSYDNAGNRDIGKTSVAMPMLIFFLQFILPPIAIGYIIWFVITYWPYVIDAAWGWYITMYTYFTNLIQGRLGCKWYIRWVTGWRCGTPNFAEYLIAWRRTYIDVPVYREKLEYIAKYRAAKERYYTKPVKHYIGDPIERAKIRNEYAQKVAMDRTVEVMLKKARDSETTGILGSSGVIGRIYGSIFGRLRRSKQDVDDMVNGYDSQTITGNSCKCPPVMDAVKGKVDTVSNVVSDIKTNISSSAGTFSACEASDRLINNRASIMGSMIVMLLLLLIAIYMISGIYGTPVFVKNIISSTNYITLSGGMYKSHTYMPYIIIAITIAMLAHTGFAYS